MKNKGSATLKRWRYLLSKLGWALSTILFVVLNFFLFGVLPGDPHQAACLLLVN